MDALEKIQEEMIFIRLVGSRDSAEMERLNKFCAGRYKEKKVLTGNGILETPDLFIVAYSAREEILGTVGLLCERKREKFPVERIFDLKFKQKTIEICRLTASCDYGFKMMFVAASIFSGLYLYAREKRPDWDFVASVKPKTMSLARRIMGRHFCRIVDYKKINKDEISDDQKVWYMGKPKPVVFLTNASLAKRGGEELLQTLNFRVKVLF